MENKTIEERAKTYAKGEGINSAIGGWEDMSDAYIAGATEQDCIARQDERERACELYRKELMQIVHVMNISSKGSGGLIDIDGSINDFRKALEEGGEG